MQRYGKFLNLQNENEMVWFCFWQSTQKSTKRKGGTTTHRQSNHENKIYEQRNKSV